MAGADVNHLACGCGQELFRTAGLARRSFNPILFHGFKRRSARCWHYQAQVPNQTREEESDTGWTLAQTGDVQQGAAQRGLGKADGLPWATRIVLATHSEPEGIYGSYHTRFFRSLRFG